MKKIYNYTFCIVCVFILVMTIYSITLINIDTNHNYVTNLNEEKVINSSVFIEEESIEIDNNLINDGINQEVDVKVVGSTTNSQINYIDTSSYNIISSEVVNISHFGPDCNGCGIGLVASGDYVGSGRINYYDKTFGIVRIVAADNKYPLGTILRLNTNRGLIIAIVLDRGGGIGDGKKYQIDLLSESEEISYKLGVIYNATLEVLRLGY